MKKRATVLLASALLLGAMTVTAVHTGAVPADPTPFLTEQPDGTAITVRTYGDEHFNWNEDDDGWLICYSEDDGAWYYAELDENNDLVPGPFAVGKENAAYVFSAEPAATRLAFEDIAEIAESRAEASIAASAVCLEELPYAEEADIPASVSSAAASSAAKKKNTDQDLLLLLIEYTDISMYETMDFWGERYFGKEKNSVTDYYMDQTGEYDLHFNRIPFTDGNTTVMFEKNSDISKIVLEDGVAKVTFNRAHPGNTDLAANDVRTAFSYVKGYIDFSGYKGDALYNNSYIRQDYFQTAAVIAGWEESNSGNRIYDQKVWAHAYRQYLVESHNRVQLAMTVKKMIYSNGTSYEPYTLLSFMMHGELYSGDPTAKTAQPMGVGVSVHEMGHCLGLPDLYDTTTSTSSTISAGLSVFSVMGNGSWGAKKGEIQGTTPTGLDAWSKIMLGFAEPVEISAKERNVSAVLTASSDQPKILKLTSPEDPNQYFLVEKRQLTGYDAGLERYYVPAYGGICIYHIDESVIASGSEINRNRYHYGVELLLADGNDILRKSKPSNFQNLYPFFVKSGYNRLAPDAPAKPLFYNPGHTETDYARGDVQCHSKTIPSWISLEVMSDSASSTEVLVNQTLVGDINNDGAVTAVDRMLLARHLARWTIDDPLNLYAADLDQDMDVDAADVEIFNRYFAGWANYTTLPHKKST